MTIRNIKKNTHTKQQRKNTPAFPDYRPFSPPAVIFPGEFPIPVCEHSSLISEGNT